MTDDPRDPLEDRLRAEAEHAGCGYHRDLYRKAADEIERLRDPAWRSQAVYRHALTEAINDLANLAAGMQHPAAKRALHRARELLRHRRDGTTPAGRNDIDQDTARESGL